MRIIQINVKNLDSFINKFIDSNYKVEYRTRVILADRSRLACIRVKKGETDVVILIVHYVTNSYLLKPGEENEDVENSTSWRIPVNPVIAIVLDNNVMNILSSYRDSYPVDNGEELVNNYRKTNPSHRDIPKLLLARVLEELRGED